MKKQDFSLVDWLVSEKTVLKGSLFSFNTFLELTLYKTNIFSFLQMAIIM